MLEALRKAGLFVPAMSPAAIEEVRRVEAVEAAKPQVKLDYDIKLYAGVYVRTVFVPAGVQITGALVKNATLLIIVGDVVIGLGDQEVRVMGFATLPAAAYRKQIFKAIAGTYITMIFATDAESEEEAEREFTDEVDLLASRKEAGCPA